MNHIRFQQIVFVFLIIAANLFGQQHKVEWVKHFGSSGNDEGVDLSVDNENNIVKISTFESAINIDGTSFSAIGGINSLLLKFTSDGQIIWKKQIGGNGVSKARSLKTDRTGNIIVCGEYSKTMIIDDSSFVSIGESDIFIAKFNTGGKLLWCKTAGGLKFDTAGDINLTVNDDILVVGRFFNTMEIAGTLLSSAGSWDIFITKISSTGKFIWAHSFKGDGFDRCWRVDTDKSGNIYMGGIFQGSLTAGKDTLYSRELFFDIYLLKLDSQGKPLWLKRAGADEGDQLYGMAIVNNNVYITGLIAGKADFDNEIINSNGPWTFGWDLFIASYAHDGKLNWVKNFGSNGADQGRKMIVSKTGQLIIAGYTQPFAVFGDTTVTGFGDDDPFFLSINTTGKINKVFSFGSSNRDWANSVAEDKNGNVYLTGKFLNYTKIGKDSIVSIGKDDIFLTKISNSTFTSVNNITELNTNYNLHQNYPNPFNPETTIKYSLSKDEFVSLKIYDLLGREVVTLVDEFKKAGTHKVNFIVEARNGASLPCGVYFYRIQAGSFTETKKLILLK